MAWTTSWVLTTLRREAVANTKVSRGVTLSRISWNFRSTSMAFWIPF